MADPAHVQVWVVELPAQHGAVVVEDEQCVVLEEESTQIVVVADGGGTTAGLPTPVLTEHMTVVDPLTDRTHTLDQIPQPSTLKVFWDSVLIWSGGLLPAWSDLDLTYDSPSRTFTAGAGFPLTIGDWLTLIYCAA